MVERLKHAVDRAWNAERKRAEKAVAASSPAPKPAVPAPPATEAMAPAPVARPVVPSTHTGPADRWQALETVSLDAKHLRRNRIVSHGRGDPAHLAFDVLRTRLLKVFRNNGWTKLAVTSPTRGCGKTVVSANLALSLARQRDLKTLLFDVNLRSPGLAAVLGIEGRYAAEWFLQGQTAPEGYLVKVSEGLALGLNSERVRDSAELMQSEQASLSLARAIDALEPDIVIYDLPALLEHDDAIAFLPNVDCVLLVAAAGRTRASEIDACERLLGESANFLGVLLNRSEEKASLST